MDEKWEEAAEAVDEKWDEAGDAGSNVAVGGPLRGAVVGDEGWCDVVEAEANEAEARESAAARWSYEWERAVVVAAAWVAAAWVVSHDRGICKACQDRTDVACHLGRRKCGRLV